MKLHRGVSYGLVNAVGRCNMLYYGLMQLALLTFSSLMFSSKQSVLVQCLCVSAVLFTGVVFGYTLHVSLSVNKLGVSCER